MLRIDASGEVIRWDDCSVSVIILLPGVLEVGVGDHQRPPTPFQLSHAVTCSRNTNILWVHSIAAFPDRELDRRFAGSSHGIILSPSPDSEPCCCVQQHLTNMSRPSFLRRRPVARAAHLATCECKLYECLITTSFRSPHRPISSSFRSSATTGTRSNRPILIVGMSPAVRPRSWHCGRGRSTPGPLRARRSSFVGPSQHLSVVDGAR